MIYTNSDGGCRGNPGPGAIGVIVRTNKTILTKYSGFIGRQVTNNDSEYGCVIKEEIPLSLMGDFILCGDYEKEL